MFSRYALPKAAGKYVKSVNSIKETIERNFTTAVVQVRNGNEAKEHNLTLRHKIGSGQRRLGANLLRNDGLLSHLGVQAVYLRQIQTSTNIPQEIRIIDSSNVISETISNVNSLGTSALEAIPEPPLIPTEEIVQTIAANGEPTFASLGLGGWTPIGIVENSLEYLHASLGIPWWGAIAIGTLVVRLLMFPLVVVAQRNAAKMNNYLPQIQVLQLKMTEARQTGNQLDAARYGQEMVEFMKEKQLNPLKNMMVPLAQMPLFISFFMSLREMANTPVDSMKYGGMFWFTDLTLPDQYFALPVITSLTMWLTIELGTDTAKLTSQNMQTMKYILRALPVVILPFTVNFPGAILCYWVCTNFISLGQVGFLRIPKVRDYFKIEKLLQHDNTQLPIQPKGFVKGVKESWTNMKISNEMEGRRRYDEMQFQRAGKGPIVKTYKYDPTKQTQKS